MTLGDLFSQVYTHTTMQLTYSKPVVV